MGHLQYVKLPEGSTVTQSAVPSTRTWNPTMSKSGYISNRILWQIMADHFLGGSMCYPAHDSLNSDSSILINGLAVCQAQIHMYC